MVVVAESKQPKGVSLQTIKKALGARGLDIVKFNRRINQAIKELVNEGKIVQVKGIGASGTFKLSKKDPSKSKSTSALTKPSVRKSVNLKVRDIKAGAPKKDEKKKKDNKKHTAKKPAEGKSSAKKSPRMAEKKRSVKPSPKKSGKVTTKKQKGTQRKSAVSSKTLGKGKK